MALLATAAAVVLDLFTEHWRVIDDHVMGGMSSGRMSASEEGLLFHGELSLENNGGFSSVRRPVPAGLSQSRGIRLTVKGDRRIYQLRLREDALFDGPAWRTEFQTDGTVQTFEFGYEEFEPVFRGSVLRVAGRIDPARIRQVGFLIADKQAGGFSLEILGLEVLY